MEESELTRKAIEELMKEMDEYREKEIEPTERKKNPLGRPNKLFLGRTINSIMNHNKRQADKNLQRCERKLQELDAEKTKQESIKYRKDNLVEFEYSDEIISSDNVNNRFPSKTRKRKRKKSRKKRYRSRSISSSSSSCSSSTDSSCGSNLPARSRKRTHKKKRHKNGGRKEEGYDQEIHSNLMGYYVDPNVAYAAMAYSQMNHLMQQQLQQEVKLDEELEENSVEIPSELSISCYSSPESSLIISLHSSSAEEDENGVLTFKLSSDDDENAKKNIGKNSFLQDYDDKECSLLSHISLESNVSGKPSINETNEVYELSSSDTDELEIVETN